MGLCSLSVICLGPNYGGGNEDYGGGNEDNGDLLQKVPCTYWYTQCHSPCSRPPPTHASAGVSWTLMGKSECHCTSLLGPGTHRVLGFCLCPPRVCFPVLCKFWWLYGGVNDNLLQERFCHTQVCCTQCPCPCGSPLLTCTSTRGTQTQFCVSLCGVSRSWCIQGLFESSEHL